MRIGVAREYKDKCPKCGWHNDNRATCPFCQTSLIKTKEEIAAEAPAIPPQIYQMPMWKGKKLEEGTGFKSIALAILGLIVIFSLLLGGRHSMPDTIPSMIISVIFIIAISSPFIYGLINGINATRRYITCRGDGTKIHAEYIGADHQGNCIFTGQYANQKNSPTMALFVYDKKKADKWLATPPSQRSKNLEAAIYCWQEYCVVEEQ